MRSVLFMVKRPYFTAIVKGEKKQEFRRPTPRWQTVFDSKPEIAVFQCGREIHRRWITGRKIYESPEQALLRKPTQEEFIMLGYGKVLGFELGEVAHVG